MSQEPASLEEGSLEQPDKEWGLSDEDNDGDEEEEADDAEDSDSDDDDLQRNDAAVGENEGDGKQLKCDLCEATPEQDCLLNRCLP